MKISRSPTMKPIPWLQIATFFLLLVLSSSLSTTQLINPRTICYEPPRIRRHLPPPPISPPPPPSPLDEIDPRYGVEKRLVPSGPNPLHN
ncbi:hypothetical protein RHMOL_Rhmol12G0083000 [Rhododendron molle]|uniref:Uncharacterized protein n=1 Tax=Rhododendron molle TaxID=49168 RepID=A0ACC0LG78_RHOML|nr:hypothetical protein RHMOL_Rhmol12G0083000 [Rhododendron molle]